MSIVRRSLVKLALLASIFFAWCTGEAAEKPWIIDTHTHFKGVDQIAVERKTRQYHPKNTLGHVLQPKDYRPVADRLAIQGTVIVEAVGQGHPSFNDWVIDQAKRSNVVCGYVARGDLKSHDFLKNYERYRKSGYLKGYRFRMGELRGYLDDERARKHLKRLEQDGIVADLLIDSKHADDVADLAKAYPKLRIVIDHCFRARMNDGKISQEWKDAVKAVAKHANVYCKMSSITNFAGTKPFEKPAPTSLEMYLEVLEPSFEAFGEDRIIFGTNWAVCNHFGRVDDVVKIVTEFLQSKSGSALRKGMRDNAIRVYNISPRHLR